MVHDRTPATAPCVDPRPASAVSGGVGLAGLVAWLSVARTWGMDGPSSALEALAATALPMIAWSVDVDRIHRRPTTGIDWSAPRPWRDTREVSLVKLAGLWATFGAVALVYGVGRFWWDGEYAFAMRCLAAGAPVLVVPSVPYVRWLDRRLVEPRDNCWAFGAWLTGTAPLDRPASPITCAPGACRASSPPSCSRSYPAASARSCAPTRTSCCAIRWRSRGG